MMWPSLPHASARGGARRRRRKTSGNKSGTRWWWGAMSVCSRLSCLPPLLCLCVAALFLDGRLLPRGVSFGVGLVVYLLPFGNFGRRKHKL